MEFHQKRKKDGVGYQNIVVEFDVLLSQRAENTSIQRYENARKEFF